MTTHEKLRERICELCPELKELKFGCEIETDNGDALITFNEETDAYLEPKDTDYPNGAILRAGQIEKIHKILGKDPTLEDVMRAIGIRNPYTEYDNRICYDDKEADIEFWEYEPKIQLGISWQLGKPLSQQSDETVEAILEILK